MNRRAFIINLVAAGASVASVPAIVAAIGNMPTPAVTRISAEELGVLLDEMYAMMPTQAEVCFECDSETAQLISTQGTKPARERDVRSSSVHVHGHTTKLETVECCDERRNIQ